MMSSKWSCAQCHRWGKLSLTKCMRACCPMCFISSLVKNSRRARIRSSSMALSFSVVEFAYDLREAACGPEGHALLRIDGDEIQVTKVLQAGIDPAPGGRASIEHGRK